jgi:hypothetical protein
MTEAKAYRLPPDWEPNSADLAFAGGFEVDCALERDKFRDHWIATGIRRVSWSATWRNWIRKAGKPKAVSEPEKKTDLFTPRGGRTLAEVHRIYGEAWRAITDDTVRSLSDDIDMAAAELEDGDRAHFRALVASTVQSLCSPLAQAVAHGRERPAFPYEEIDFAKLRARTESQLHSIDGYEGRKNLIWWQRRYPEKYGGPPAPPPIELKPAREIRDPVVTPFRNPNA